MILDQAICKLSPLRYATCSNYERLCRWVYGPSLPANESTNHTIYTPRLDTLKKGRNFTIGYLDGTSASGVVYADSVTVGGLTAPSQAVEVATSVSSQLVARPHSGFIGFAFPSNNNCEPTKCKTWFRSIESLLPRKQKLFTSTLKHQAPGTYDFGYIDQSKYTGTLVYKVQGISNWPCYEA